MRKATLIVGILLAAVVQIQAQDCCKRAELFGSFSFFSSSSKTDRIPANFDFRSTISQRGYGLDLAYKFKKNFAFVGDFSRNMKDEIISGSKADTATDTYLFGVRLSPPSDGMSPFAEALVGAVKRRNAIADLRVSNANFALGFGAGVDIHASRNFSIRALRFDYITDRGGVEAPGAGPRWGQNFRVQVGILYRFGPLVQ